MRIVFTLLLLISLTLPLFTVKKNITDSVSDYAFDKIAEGNWGTIANRVLDFIEITKDKNENQTKNIIDRLKNGILTGYGLGFSSIGASFMVWNNYRYGKIDIVPILPVVIIFLTLIQISFHNYFYRNRNSIIGIFNMLLVLSVFGNCIRHAQYSGYLNGLLIFLAIQILYMGYFYWFPYKKTIKVHDENQ